MKILLATDGSEYSFAAARKCCGMIAFVEDSTIKVISIGAKIISTIQFIVRHADCSVLVIRASEEEFNRYKSENE